MPSCKITTELSAQRKKASSCMRRAFAHTGMAPSRSATFEPTKAASDKDRVSHTSGHVEPVSQPPSTEESVSGDEQEATESQEQELPMPSLPARGPSPPAYQPRQSPLMAHLPREASVPEDQLSSLFRPTARLPRHRSMPRPCQPYAAASAPPPPSYTPFYLPRQADTPETHLPISLLPKPRFSHRPASLARPVRPTSMRSDTPPPAYSVSNTGIPAPLEPLCPPPPYSESGNAFE